MDSYSEPMHAVSALQVLSASVAPLLVTYAVAAQGDFVWQVLSECEPAVELSYSPASHTVNSEHCLSLPSVRLVEQY
jgi:hypothetical protein